MSIHRRYGAWLAPGTLTYLSFGLCMTVVGLSTAAFAYDGADGRNGRDGLSVTVIADGSPQSRDISGGDGGDGDNGSDGMNAMCEATGGPGNVSEPSGGQGGRGGSGGAGGSGGDITVYYSDISNVGRLFFRANPGSGGRGAYGGRGGSGCRCGQYSWTIPASTPEGQPQTYSCTDGYDGQNGYNGGNGPSGSYGRILLVNQTAPLQPALPSVYVDMSKMETGPITLSQNGWEKRAGARQLFQSGSDIGNNYWFFTGRTELEYTFRWAAKRPVTDFAGFHMLVKLNGTDGQVTFPDGIWVDSEVVADGNKRIYTFKSVVASNEVGNLSLGAMTGFGQDLAISVKDGSHLSDVIHTTVTLEYFTAANGSYQSRYKDVVPAEALSINADGFSIAFGNLGLKPEFLQVGTQNYIGLTIRRGLGSSAAAYSLGQYGIITLVLKLGDAVEPTGDFDMMTQTTVVDHVTKGEKCHVTKIQGDWIQLEKVDGTAIKGWIQRANLTLSTL